MQLFVIYVGKYFPVDTARCRNSKSEDTFISLGFEKCKKAVEKFKEHESCNAHYLGVGNFDILKAKIYC